MTTKRILITTIAAITAIALQSGKPDEYSYRYDTNGNVTSRRVTSIAPMTLTDETDFEEDKEIIINYDIVGKKAEITVTNPSEEFPVNVMIFDGLTNLLIEEHTFSTDNFTLDLSAKRQGIYLITASDGNVIQSIKILKD